MSEPLISAADAIARHKSGEAIFLDATWRYPGGPKAKVDGFIPKAIAFDIDPSKNRAWSRKKYPKRPHPFQIGWDEFSDIPEGVIIAFESCGFEWGARWKTFCDPMHFSLRKIGK